MKTASRVGENRAYLRRCGHPLTQELTGQAVRLEYGSGQVMEQHWQTDNLLLWKGIGGNLEGYERVDYYQAFKLTEGFYLVHCSEELGQTDIGYPNPRCCGLCNVVLDFIEMRATACCIGPATARDVEHVLDQALMTFVECDLNEQR